MEPSDLAAAIERDTRPLTGPGDRFHGYGLLGLTFADGDVLAMRRFPSTSREPSYTSVWHRTPDRRWTFYTDIGGGRGCTRYFAPAITETIVTPIRVEWLSSRHLTVSIDGGRLLSWSVCLTRSARSRLVTAVAPVLPAWCWERPTPLKALEAAVRMTLGTGHFHLAGRTPSGHEFRLKPLAVWPVQATRARLCGRDLGTLAALDPQAALADFWIPRRGLFVAGHVAAERNRIILDARLRSVAPESVVPGCAVTGRERPAPVPDA